MQDVPGPGVVARTDTGRPEPSTRGLDPEPVINGGFAVLSMTRSE